MTIGKITREHLRDVWKHEAKDFTTWLVDNVDVLTDALGFTLKNPEREQSAGDFSVDLTAEDEDGNPVVIENQLEKSNHDHLGKLITYVSSLGARTALWIVAHPRPEHVQAITWLNSSGLARFYLLKIEAIRIGESLPAPLLTLITGPSEDSTGIDEKKKDIVERYELRHRFWDTLLARAKPITKLHGNISPTRYSWIATGAGKYGLQFEYSVTQHANSVELVIDRGKDSDQENEGIFQELKAHQPGIEKAFGEQLDWYSQNDVRLRRIRLIRPGGYRDEEGKWPDIQSKMIDAMVRLEKSLKPYLQTIA